MNIANNGQAKSLVKRFPILCCLVFALYLISFKSTHVYASVSAETKYSLIQSLVPSTYSHYAIDEYNIYFSNDHFRYDTQFYVEGTYARYNTMGETMGVDTGGTGRMNLYTVFYCNENIKNGSDVVVFPASSLPPPETSASTIKFIQPNTSPFLDTTDGFNFLISYTVPIGTSHNDFSLVVSCPDFDPSKWEITGQEYNSATGQGWLKCFISPVSVGLHTVTAKIGTKTTNTIIERLGGSVDANGDGIDDRTNLPVGDGHVKVSDPTGSGAIGALENMKDFMGSMSDFSGKIFGFLPNEVRYTMIFVISVMGFIAIKKFLL